jgi:6-phosphofructokinase 1
METAAGGTDPSGNRVLGDIGIFLKMRVQDYFRKKNRDVVVKYIDPSYIIRSAPAHPNDSIFCARLGVNAVHAAMAGKTELLVSQVNNKMVYLPIRVAVSSRNRIDPESPLWRDVLEATGQAPLMVNGAGKGPDSVRS